MFPLLHGLLRGEGDAVDTLERLSFGVALPIRGTTFSHGDCLDAPYKGIETVTHPIELTVKPAQTHQYYGHVVPCTDQ